MIRKPEPKEAAKAIIEMFAKKGITVPRSLALEVVATVEGYNDWNTMSALVPTVVKAAKVPTDVRFPKVDDDDGPFEVHFTEGYYDTFERFSRAEEVAEMFAAELDSEHILEILDSQGKVRAKYVGDHTRFRTYQYVTCGDMSVENAKAFAAEDLDEEDADCFGHPENFYDDIVAWAVNLELSAEANPDEEEVYILGYRQFETNPETGRVVHSDLRTPIQLGLLVVQAQLRYVSPDFPADVRERIAALVK